MVNQMKYYLKKYLFPAILLILAALSFPGSLEDCSIKQGAMKFLALEKKDFRLGPFECGGKFDLGLAKQSFGEICSSNILYVTKLRRTNKYFICPFYPDDKTLTDLGSNHYLYLFSYEIKFDQAEFTVVDGKIESMDIYIDKYPTARGIRIGDNAGKIIRQYGHPERMCEICQKNNFSYLLETKKKGDSSVYWGITMNTNEQNKVQRLAFARRHHPEELFWKSIYDKKIPPVTIR